MRRPIRTSTTAAAIAVAAGVIIATAGEDHGSTQRHHEVAQRGAEVMPFDLDATTHRFIKAPDGGRQIVVADAEDDRRQVRLIRLHLREEARAFARGDFDDPASIHGAEMAGLDTLRTAGSKLDIRLEDRADGAELIYRTTDAAVRRALHNWFDAQVSDHGGHAQSN